MKVKGTLVPEAKGERGEQEGVSSCCDREKANKPMKEWPLARDQRTVAPFGALPPISFITSLSDNVLPAQLCTRSAVHTVGLFCDQPPPTPVGDSTIQVTQEVLSHSFL